MTASRAPNAKTLKFGSPALVPGTHAPGTNPCSVVSGLAGYDLGDRSPSTGASRAQPISPEAVPLRHGLGNSVARERCLEGLRGDLLCVPLVT
jgi:hypothetical protein